MSTPKSYGITDTTCDDFTVVASTSGDNVMFTSVASNASSSRYQFCQVIFHDLSEVYPTDSDIKFRYSLVSGLEPRAGDRIALFKVGWSSVSEYLTSIFTAGHENPSSTTLSVTLPVECLPKNETDMYQLCYVTCDGTVAGASIPFTFRRPQENELVAVEDPQDPSLYVFKSRSSQLQDQLVSERAKKENCEKVIVELNSRLSKLNVDLISKMSESDKYKEKISELEQDIVEYSSSMKKLEKRLKENDANSGVLEELLEDLKKKDSDVLECQMMISRMDREKDLLEASIKSMQEELSNKDKELTECKQQNESLQISWIKMNQEVTQVRLELESLKNPKSSLNEEEIETLKRKLMDELSNKDKELTECKQLNESLEISLVNLNQELTQVRAEFESLKNSKSSVNEEEIETLKRKLKDMSERHNKTVLEKLETIERLRAAETVVETKDQELRKQVSTIEELHCDMSDLRYVLESVQDEKNALQAELNTLREQSSNSDENIALAMHHVEEEMCNKFLEEIEKMKSQSSRGWSPMNLLDNLKNVITLEWFKSDKEAGPSKKTSDIGINYKEELRKMSQELLECRHSKEEAVAAYCDLQQEVKQLREDLKKNEEMNQDYVEQLQTVLNSKDAADTDYQEEVAALRSRILVLEKELSKASSKDSKSSHRRPKMQELVEENARLKWLLEKSEDVCNNLRRNVEGLMKTTAEQFARIIQAEKERDVALSRLTASLTVLGIASGEVLASPGVTSAATSLIRNATSISSPLALNQQSTSSSSMEAEAKDFRQMFAILIREMKKIESQNGQASTSKKD